MPPFRTEGQHLRQDQGGSSWSFRPSAADLPRAPAPVRLQRLEGHGLRHVKVALPRESADCYSIAAADAGLAVLAYYTSSQVDALLADYRTGAAQDAETTSAISAALLTTWASPAPSSARPRRASGARRAWTLHFGAFGGSIPGLVQQSAGALDLYSVQIRARG